jgi:hypothetical protein
MGTTPTVDNTSGDKVVPIETVLKSLPQDKIEAAIVENAATLRVTNDPLPGPMLDAVANQELEVITSKGKIVFRPIVIYDFTLFKKLNSPHYRTMLEANSGVKIEEMNIEDEELYEMIYQFTHSCKEIRTLLKKGRENFRELATEEVGDKYNVQDLGVLLQGVATQIQKGFATMMAHGVEADKDKDALDEVGEKKTPSVS